MFRLFIFLPCLLDLQSSSGQDDSFQLPPSFTQGESPDVFGTDEYNLLDGIKIPFQDFKTQYMEMADDGFMAFGFRNGSDVKMAHRVILPESLSEEFSVVCDLKPKSNRGGFIFAVVNSRENVVQFGVKLTNQEARTVIELFYTPAGVMTSQSIANFNVPNFTDRWTKFALRVTSTKVTLFFNCTEAETLLVDRDPLRLTFESASTLYLAQAGPNLGEAFEGAFALLKIYGNPDVAAEQCRDYPDLTALVENDNVENEALDDPYLDSSNEIPSEDYDVSPNVERTDYPPYRKEDGEWGGEFPPPPPPPDGKNACLCGLDCCNIFNDTQAAGRLRGPKGDRGMRGPPGESVRGPPGPPGPPGLPGVAAPEPTCSCNLSSIISSIQHSGSYSSSAAGGKDGLPGLPGEPGRPGERGPTGPRGEKGERGERGPPGPPGPPGVRGEHGKEGPPGPPGPPGEMGPPGPTEVDGSPGNARPGIPGSKGEPGKNGTKGDKGPPGPRGPSGPKGDRGDRGLPGPKGAPGVDGFPGTPGSKGEPGTPGLPGVVTANGNATIVECPPGPPGVKGTSGTKGEPGEKGDKGAGSKGVPGDKGESGMDGAIGPVGPPGSKGERGERGPPGEIFLQKGEDGERKLLTLKGEKGDMGRRGRRGKAGPQGPPGPPGKLGELGLPGWTGRPGLPGPKGDKGDSWSGPTPKGEKGDAGTPGKDSESRFIPVPGPPGPPGPPGLPGLSITGPKGEPGETIMSEPLFNMRPGRSTDTPPIAHAVTQKKETPPMGGAMAFRSRSIMLEATKGSPIGTMVYIIEEESLLLRVGAGWQYVALGALLHTEANASPHQTTAEPPQVNPPFESSNLVHHNVPIKPLLPEEVPLEPVRSIEEAKTTQFAALRLAALNDPYPGNSGGIRGADYDCYREAHRAGIRGTFRAFLASRGQDVSSIVRQVDRVLPVTNLRGEVLFDSWMQIFDGRGAQFAHQPRIFSFNGKNIMTDPYWPQKSVWHGAAIDGTRALDTSCEGWHSGHPHNFGLAGNLKGQMLMDQNKVPCDRKLILLCIEATSEIFVQRRRRDLRHNKLLTEEQYQDFLISLDQQ